MNVERCLGMLRSCLKDDGLIFTVEFEGAFRFQLQELQVRWINAAIRVLPKALRPFPPGPGVTGRAAKRKIAQSSICRRREKRSLRLIRPKLIVGATSSA
jgi:hypothetical protein